MHNGIPAFEHTPNSRFLGFPMSQNRYAIPAWSYFFELVQPAQIIEIGTNCGGMTCLLGIAAKRIGATMHTIDTGNDDGVDAETMWWFHMLGIDRITADVFQSDIAASLASRPGASLLLCDGGNKVREFNEFAPHLKPGDYIATHDWHAHEDWPWQEIQLFQIEETVATCGLVEVMPEVFARTGWKVFQRMVKNASV